LLHTSTKAIASRNNYVALIKDQVPDWVMIDFTTSPERSELLADMLWAMGVVAIEERATGTSLVTLRTSMGEDPTDAINAVRIAFPDVITDIVGVPRSVADTWREHATATWINEAVALVPAWVTAPDGSLPIFIEPLDTFGLGNHPTTVLALRLALLHIASDTHVIDVGCGSGVLAIALSCVKNCSGSVYDIAESARGAVDTNALLNGSTNVEWTDNWQAMRTDALLANILAPVLKAESVSIQTTVNDGGLIVLSGMRTEQVDGVLKHYSQCREIDRATLDGWTAVVLQKQ
jgi:ribosomal protein L11 methyltransferase